MVRIRAFQARGPGSIPGRCIIYIIYFIYLLLEYMMRKRMIYIYDNNNNKYIGPVV